jgi:toxin ParE1/3/4
VNYNVYIISDAEEDIIDLYSYIAISDSFAKAEYLLNKIQETCSILSDLPNRGHVPPELERVGVIEYREIHFKPHRIIYQVIESNVYIHCILDSRKELQELLEKRIIR